MSNMTTMAKFLSDRGWYFAGNCGCAANKSKWLHPEHPIWRIQTQGNNYMTFEQQQNPMNKVDFKAVMHANQQNYNLEYEKFFPKITPSQDAPKEITQ